MQGGGGGRGSNLATLLRARRRRKRKRKRKRKGKRTRKRKRSRVRGWRALGGFAVRGAGVESREPGKSESVNAERRKSQAPPGQGWSGRGTRIRVGRKSTGGKRGVRIRTDTPTSTHTCHRDVKAARRGRWRGVGIPRARGCRRPRYRGAGAETDGGATRGGSDGRDVVEGGCTPLLAAPATNNYPWSIHGGSIRQVYIHLSI